MVTSQHHQLEHRQALECRQACRGHLLQQSPTSWIPCSPAWCCAPRDLQVRRHRLHCAGGQVPQRAGESVCLRPPFGMTAPSCTAVAGSAAGRVGFRAHCLAGPGPVLDFKPHTVQAGPAASAWLVLGLRMKLDCGQTALHGTSCVIVCLWPCLKVTALHLAVRWRLQSVACCRFCIAL